MTTAAGGREEGGNVHAECAHWSGIVTAMSGIQLLRAGCVVYCVAIVMAGGVIVALVTHWPLTVRAIVMAIMALCILAGSALTAIGSIKTAIRAQELRLAAQLPRREEGR